MKKMELEVKILDIDRKTNDKTTITVKHILKENETNLQQL